MCIIFKNHIKSLIFFIVINYYIRFVGGKDNRIKIQFNRHVPCLQFFWPRRFRFVSTFTKINWSTFATNILCHFIIIIIIFADVTSINQTDGFQMK